MNDHYLPLAYFAVLFSIAVVGAFFGRKAGRQGLKGALSAAWVLLLLWWSLFAAGPLFSLSSLFAVAIIFAFALSLVYFPMSFVVESKSFLKLFFVGIIGSAVSSFVSLYVGLFIACAFGDCL